MLVLDMPIREMKKARPLNVLKIRQLQFLSFCRLGGSPGWSSLLLANEIADVSSIKSANKTDGSFGV